jgi:hypothetical protein
MFHLNLLKFLSMETLSCKKNIHESSNLWLTCVSHSLTKYSHSQCQKDDNRRLDSYTVYCNKHFYWIFNESYTVVMIGIWYHINTHICVCMCVCVCVCVCAPMVDILWPSNTANVLHWVILPSFIQLQSLMHLFLKDNSSCYYNFWNCHFYKYLHTAHENYSSYLVVFFNGLFNILFIALTLQCQTVGRLVHNKLQNYGKQQSWLNMRYYPDICLEKEKPQKPQSRQCPQKDLNQTIVLQILVN